MEGVQLWGEYMLWREYSYGVSTVMEGVQLWDEYCYGGSTVMG